MSDILDDKSTKQPCIWCQRPRMRNDLCNRCRQRVESRARKIVQTKLIGDMSVITDALLFMSNQITSTPELFNITHLQYNELLTQALPFIVCFFFIIIFTCVGHKCNWLYFNSIVVEHTKKYI